MSARSTETESRSPTSRTPPPGTGATAAGPTGTANPTETTVNHDRLRQEIGWWLERGDNSLLELATATEYSERRLRGYLQGDVEVSVDRAVRLLDEIGFLDRGSHYHPTTGRALKRVITWGKQNRKVRGDQIGRLKRFDFSNAFLTENELRVVYRVHIEGGLSLREIGRRYWKKWGYASDRACANSLSDRLRELGLQPRSRSEATIAANRARSETLHPGETPRQYRVRKEREKRESDPALMQAHLDRIAWLRTRPTHARRKAA